MAEAKRIVVEYDDGNVKEMEKGFAAEFDNDTMHMDMLNVSKVDIVRIAYGMLVTVDKMGMTSLLQAFASGEMLPDEIGDLRKENGILKNRLNNSLPIHTLAYLVINSIVGAIAATLLFVRFILNIYIIDPYYLICAFIISVGLFLTALTSLRDWKGNLLR